MHAYRASRVPVCMRIGRRVCVHACKAKNDDKEEDEERRRERERDAEETIKRNRKESQTLFLSLSLFLSCTTLQGTDRTPIIHAMYAVQQPDDFPNAFPSGLPIGNKG